MHRILFIVFLYNLFSTQYIMAQEDKDYKVNKELYTYYHQCQVNIGNPSVLLMIDSLNSMAKAREDVRMLAVSLSLKLDYYYFKGENEDSIIKYVNQVKDFAKATNQLKYYYFAWSDRLILHYLKTGNSTLALFQAQEMLKDAQQRDSKIGLLACYNSLYQIYEIKDLKSLAIEYCLKAIELTENYKMDNYNIAFYYTTAAKYYIDQHELQLAREYLTKAEDNANAEIHMVKVKLAHVHYYLALNNPSKAWEILQECRNIYDIDKKNAVYRKAFYENEFQYYKKTGQYHKALEAADNQIAEELLLNESALKNSHYRMKGEIYLAMNRKELAADFFHKYIEHEDSVRLNNEQITTSGYATLVNLEKVEKEKNELLLHAQKKELHTKQIIIFSLVALLGLVLYFLYRENLLNKCLVKSEEDLRKAKNKAESASKIKTNFIQSMSHEIRTPLNSIVGFSQILGSKYENDIESKEYASIIETNSNHLLRLINHVLELSDLDKLEDIDCNFVTDINECCNLSIETVRKYVQEGVELNFTPTTKRLIITSNPERIIQVLNNILHNATKFTQKGAINLTYNYTEKEKIIYFCITDTGCGIPQDKYEEVFNRFSKLNTYTQGSGLGLSISQEIARRMGGDLYIDKNYANGARFIFSIPYK